MTKLLLLFALVSASMTAAERVGVLLKTDAGDIEIEVMLGAAPISAGSFLAHVDAGLLDGGGFYRTVYPENDNGSPKISVIQGGILPDTEGLPAVAHETTEQTSMLHLDGVISLARGEVGSGSGGTFFICIGDQPSLDMGGGRAVSGDGQGFAAFGRVVKGMEVVKKIHQSKTNSANDDAYTAGGGGALAPVTPASQLTALPSHSSAPGSATPATTNPAAQLQFTLLPRGNQPRPSPLDREALRLLRVWLGRAV